MKIALCNGAEKRAQIDRNGEGNIRRAFWDLHTERNRQEQRRGQIVIHCEALRLYPALDAAQILSLIHI